MTHRLPPFTAVPAFGATFFVLRSGGDNVAGGLPDVSSSTGSIALPSATTDQRIAIYQDLVRAHPENIDATVQLAAAYLQKVRENGDASLYIKADGLLAGALRRKPDDVGALTERGTLELSR